MLSLFLDCIEALDYPKSSIVLHVRSKDSSESIQGAWIASVGNLYAAVEFNKGDVTEPVERPSAHEPDAVRRRANGDVRDRSLQLALERDCAFYFVAGVDNFIRPCTLRELASGLKSPGGGATAAVAGRRAA